MNSSFAASPGSKHLMRFAGMLGGVALLAAPLHAQSGNPAARDSLDALMKAISDFRVFQHQYNATIEQQIVALSRAPKPSASFNSALADENVDTLNTGIFGLCEHVLRDFCFGPTNGGMDADGSGTWPASLRYSDDKLPQVFRRAANRLLNAIVADLARARRDIPGDRWINGELVRISWERGHASRALDEAERCTAIDWWCSALRAYVHSASGDWATADTSWSRALRQMPATERCAWLDPTAVIPDSDFRSRFSAMSCEEQVRAAERLWWLSDPMFMTPYNERRSEHLARVMHIVLLEGAQRAARQTASQTLRSEENIPRTPAPVPLSAIVLDEYGTLGDPTPLRQAAGWGTPIMPSEEQDTLGLLKSNRLGYPELVLRAGVPVSFAEDLEPPVTNFRTRKLIAIYSLERFAFIPDGRAALDPFSARPSDWSLSAPDAFEFIAPWPREMLPLGNQLAWFRRGDSSQLVAATNLPAELKLTSRSLVAGMVLQRDYDATAHPLRGARSGDRYYFSGRLRPESTVVSIEMRAAGGAMARTRFGTGPAVRPTQRIQLSDILLIDAHDDPPGSLDAATRRALGTTRVSREQTLGIFWEVYGLAPRETPRVSVVAARQAGGVLSMLGRALGLQNSNESLVVGWNEPPVEGLEIEPRSVNISISSLDPGDYTLSIAVQIDGEPLAETVRAITILPR